MATRRWPTPRSAKAERKVPHVHVARSPPHARSAADTRPTGAPLPAGHRGDTRGRCPRRARVPRRHAAPGGRVRRRRRVLRHLGIPHHRLDDRRSTSYRTPRPCRLLRAPRPPDPSCRRGRPGVRLAVRLRADAAAAPGRRRQGRPGVRGLSGELAVHQRPDRLHGRGPRLEPAAALLVARCRRAVLSPVATAAARRRGGRPTAARVGRSRRPPPRRRRFGGVVPAVPALDHDP